MDPPTIPGYLENIWLSVSLSHWSTAILNYIHTHPGVQEKNQAIALITNVGYEKLPLWDKKEDKILGSLCLLQGSKQETKKHEKVLVIKGEKRTISV